MPLWMLEVKEEKQLSCSIEYSNVDHKRRNGIINKLIDEEIPLVWYDKKMRKIQW